MGFWYWILTNGICMVIKKKRIALTSKNQWLIHEVKDLCMWIPVLVYWIGVSEGEACIHMCGYKAISSRTEVYINIFISVPCLSGAHDIYWFYRKVWKHWRQTWVKNVCVVVWKITVPIVKIMTTTACTWLYLSRAVTQSIILNPPVYFH